MTANKPIYLLFCEGQTGQRGNHPMDERGRWRFVLENIETGERIEAGDTETVSHPDRTALLAVMRGLEALEQPSRVTLITTNRYVARGLQYGLVEWRENDYCWEHFGSVQPVRNADLWRRIDGALRYHEVLCRWMAEDAAADGASEDARAVPIVTIEDAASVQVREDAERTAARPHAFPRNGAEMMRGQRTAARRDCSLTLVSSRESVCVENSSEDAWDSEGIADEPGYGGSRGDNAESEAADALDPAPGARSLRVTRGTQCAAGGASRDTESIEDDRCEDYFRDATPSGEIQPEDWKERRASELGLAAYQPGGAGGLPEAVAVPSLIRRPVLPWIVRVPVGWVWEGILALDSFLVSCLRCMLLLDPRPEGYRSGKR
jgi:ribonuclease HI